MRKPKRKAICIALGAIVLGLIAIVAIRVIADWSFVFISFPTIGHSDTFYPANNWRPDSSQDSLICVDGQLFFLKVSEKTVKVYRFQNNQSEKVFQTSNFSSYIGSSNEYLYYINREEKDWGNYTLLCCNILNGEEYRVYYGKIDFCHPYFSTDGSLYIPLEGSTPTNYIHVSGAELLSDHSPGETFALGEKEYSMIPEKALGDDWKLLCTDQNGAANLVSFPKEDPIRAVIPYHNGLLVYTTGYGNFSFYWIDEYAAVTELFSAPCMYCTCAFNMCGTDVYFSFKRYETYGNIGMLRYENDDLEGTWKISLTDFSVKKLNDNIFYRMYHFDDTGFYCVDDDWNWNLFKMDFEGEVVPIRVRRKIASQLGKL